jgi:hypothetical protein
MNNSKQLEKVLALRREHGLPSGSSIREHLTAALIYRTKRHFADNGRR